MLQYYLLRKLDTNARAGISYSRGIKFNFYGSIPSCLSFRNVDGEAKELSVCLPDFNLQSMRQRWRQIHVADLVSVHASLPGQYNGSISKSCEYGETLLT